MWWLELVLFLFLILLFVPELKFPLTDIASFPHFLEHPDNKCGSWENSDVSEPAPNGPHFLLTAHNSEYDHEEGHNGEEEKLLEMHITSEKDETWQIEKSLTLVITPLSPRAKLSHKNVHAWIDYVCCARIAIGILCWLHLGNSLDQVPIA